MQILTDFFNFLPQCCDAKNYLQIGQECATQGVCYNDLRPMGAGYWFSIPYRLGWQIESLIYIHWLLMIVSIFLSIIAITKLCAQNKIHLPLRGKIALFALSTFLHGIFLYPILRIAITDAPASLIVLISTWLLIITPKTGISRVLLLITAGLLLGLSSWMRVFYLIPVSFVAVAWIIVWLCNQKRKLYDLTFLVILFPIIIQYGTSFKHNGRLEYLPPDPGLVEVHFDTTATGYDSVLPGYAFYWYGPCNNYKPIRAALQSYDIHSLACQALGKLNFYLGSYSAAIYWLPDSYNLITSFNFNINNTEHKLTAVNISQEESNPASADKYTPTLRLWKNKIKSNAEIIQNVELSEQYKYKISLQAWSPVNYQYITLEIKDHATNNTELKSELLLTDTPQQIVLNKYLSQSGLKDIVLGFPYIRPDSENGKKAKAIGATVNEGYFYIADVRFEKADLKQMRTWSYWILFANLLATVGTGLFIKKNRSHLKDTQWLALVFLGTCCLILLVIAPEQRFAISPLITIWVLFLSWVTIVTSESTQFKIPKDIANGHH